jgi:hypothetical protein
MDVVALNVVRRTAAYSCRLRLSDGGGLSRIGDPRGNLHRAG